MNYKSFQSFEVAGKDAPESVSVLYDEDGSIVLKAATNNSQIGTIFVKVPLTDADQVAALINELQDVWNILSQRSGMF